MTQDHVLILYQIVVFLFAISVHESAHAWTAMRCGDPTAYMLGRVTLNPIKHIDIFGTIILPLVAALAGFPIIGWAKPTPVNPRNFKNLMRDDILTSVAGPISNFLICAIAVALMLAIAVASPTGRLAVWGITRGVLPGGNSVVVPIVLLLYTAMELNALLGVFNLIPVPPLDGSHVLRHLLPDNIRMIYDRVGMFAMLLLFLVGGRFLGMLFDPVMTFLVFVLQRFVAP